MLNPNYDRLDYGELLAPPAGSYLDFAIGTTYSLDLDALVGASLALGLSAETDSGLMNNPICLLEALRSTGDNVALFCEGGQIHLPRQVNPLYVLLEKMVFTVKTPKRRGLSSYPSFHPKFWLIKYVDETGKATYRFIILSRNLTFDRSWDVAFCMDGTVKGNKRNKNLPLCDFLQYLLTQVPKNEHGKEKARRIRGIMRELPYVKFELESKVFSDFTFLPIGVKRDSGDYHDMGQTRLFKDTFHEVFIISPFVNGKVLSGFNERNYNSGIKNPKYTLITRKASLVGLKPAEVSNFKIYTMRDAVTDGETAISDDSQSVQTQDIHAKVYMVRKYSDAYLYLGSLNATHNALHGNVEFMLKLKSRNRYLNTDKLTSSLFGSDKDGKDNPFEAADVIEEETMESSENNSAMEAVVKEISRNMPTAKVKEDDGDYSINVYFNEIDAKGFKVEVRPLLSERTKPFSKELTFEKMRITSLSEFFAIKVSNKNDAIERVIMIPVDGMPEDRERAVVADTIKADKGFYRYISFLLGDDEVLSILESEEVKRGMVGSHKQGSYIIPALYEKMLKTAATAPERFKGIDYLMNIVDEDGVIPEDFKRLYETFKKAVKI